LPAEPSISVVIRTIDRPDRLGEALDSLARQTRRDFEAVIVDMSGGAAADVVGRHAARFARLQHRLVGRRLSCPEALNEGIRHAAADRIAILDDDNLYDPTHVAALVEGLERTEADLVYTGVRRATYTPAGEPVDVAVWHAPYDFCRLLAGNFIHTAGTAFWKRVWTAAGGYDPRFPAGSDHEFLIRVGRHGSIARLPAVTAESRSFTGRPGVQHHALATRDVRRSQAGIYWRHRALYVRHARSIWAQRPRTAPGVRSDGMSPVRRWTRRAMLGSDLVGWWWHCHRPAGRAR
jgi:hypothetical protein